MQWISSRGKVINPAVVESQPEGVFNKLSLKAINYYSYLLRVTEGEAMVVKGVKVKIHYGLSNENASQFLDEKHSQH